MKIQLGKNVVIKDWESHPSSVNWWLRPIEYLDRDFPASMDNLQEVFVWIHRAKTYYAWEIQFTNKSGLKHLEVPLFRLWELEDAKAYVDDLITRITKISVFI